MNRSWVLTSTALFHRLIVSNFAPTIVQIPFGIAVGADFADLFEVRGVTRERHGEFLDTEVSPGRIKLGYHGLDGIARFTEVMFDPESNTVSIVRR